MDKSSSEDLDCTVDLDCSNDNDKSYEITSNDKANEKYDLQEDFEEQPNSKKRTVRNCGDEVRKRKKPNRFGSRESTSNYDSFFNNLPDNSVSNEADEIQMVGSVLEKTLTSQTDITSDDITLETLYNLVKISVEKVEHLQKHVREMDNDIIKLNVIIQNQGCGQLNRNKRIETTRLKPFDLPVESQADLDKFESNLKTDAEFADKLTDVLIEIGGTNGKSDGEQVLKDVVDFIIEPKFLAGISWTGRGKKGEKKIPLRLYVHIVDLLNVVAQNADKKMTRRKVRKTLTYNVLKRAPGKLPLISGSSSSSSSSSLLTSSPSPTECNDNLSTEVDGAQTQQQHQILQQQQYPLVVQSNPMIQQQQQLQQSDPPQQQPQQFQQQQMQQQKMMHAQQMHPKQMPHINPMQQMPFYGYPWQAENGYQYNLFQK